jgi:two-component system LytT family response regulator
MSRLRCYAVDDEELSLASLLRLLEGSGRADVVGASCDPVQAVQEIRRLQPEALFIDIHMPELDGFALLRELARPPLVVFTTAYHQHAVRAFEVNSVDYLLKPITTARLMQALQRLEERIAHPAPDIGQLLEQLAAQLKPFPYLRRVASQRGEQTLLIEVSEVTHFQAEDRFTYAVTADGKLLVSVPLSDLEKRLDPACFVRIHRSVIVNLAYVDTVSRWFGGRLLIRLKDRAGTELPVSRANVGRLREALGL